MKRWATGFALLAIVVATALVMSCAEERDPINRVQPNVVKKAMLDGEWYFHQKVVDVPGGELQGWMYPAIVGWYSAPERIRFEIQENFLYVRRVREKVERAETYNREYDPDFSSYALLATFPIISHFDIQRDYNPVTGESMNVVSENRSDRPWWEREYIRVDWSQNLTPSWDGIPFIDQAWHASTPFFVESDCTPDREFAKNEEDRCIPDDKAPFFDIVWNDEGTSLTKGYFDVTTQSTLNPGVTWYPGFGEIPYCWLFEHEGMECSAAQYFVRNSFWKYVPEEHDFERMPYSGKISDQFGFFFSDYLEYDEQETVVERNRRYFLERHNIWEQSHQFDKLCKTSADCCATYDADYKAYLAKFGGDEAAAANMAEANCISTCDSLLDLNYEDRSKFEKENECSFHVTESNLQAECVEMHYCTLPYNERRVRPIVYYTNKEWPEELNHVPTDPGVGDDEATREAFKWAYADQEGETRSTNEQISDRWSAVYVRVINILKNKAAGKPVDPNIPYLDDDMKRTEPGTGKFDVIGVVAKDSNGVPTGKRGFDENWYDPERPPYVLCRFAPALGPNNDPDGVEPDICWERIQENSHCVFDPKNPGVNPKTGGLWTEASSWPLCAEREKTPRLGDIRYSMAYWVDKWYEGFRLLGLGPGNSDPITGETLSGSAHLYMHNDMAARRIVDATLLITGDIDAKEYINGLNLNGWRNKYTGSGLIGPQGNSLAQIGSLGGLMSENLKQSQKFTTSGVKRGGSETKGQYYDIEQMVQQVAGSPAAASFHDSEAMLNSIATHPEGASVEAALFNDANAMNLFAANGIDPNADVQNEELKNRMLITRNNPFKLAEIQNEIREWMVLNQRADYGESTAESASVSLAYEVRELKRQGKLPAGSDAAFRNAVWRLARKKLMHAVTTHEIGHSLGLRHNFGGSQDFLNYKETYWDIRTNGCADVSQDDKAPPLTGELAEAGWDEENDCGNSNPVVGPRYIRYAEGKPWSGDPLSKYEIYKKIQHQAYSSIMDYAGTYHIDEDGLGRYDWAAMLYGYGHHFEVYKYFPAGYRWKTHDTLVPGIVSEDGTAGAVIPAEGFVEKNYTAPSFQAGALVVNMTTGEEAIYTGGLTESPQVIRLEGAGFAQPMKKGDKFAIWGPPLDGDSLLDPFYEVKDWLGRYQEQYGNVFLPLYSYFFAPHYTTWLDTWGQEDQSKKRAFNEQSNRDVRDIRIFDWRVTSESGISGMVTGFDLRLAEGEDPEVMRVPYVYCTDNRANISSDCRMRDYGADDWERMHNFIDDWDRWYISRSFQRSRFGWWPNQYPVNNYDRFYRVPKNYNDLFALYAELMSQFYDERAETAMFTDGWNSWGGTTLAVADGFNMLMQAIAAPDTSNFVQYAYEPRVQDGRTALVTEPYTTTGGSLMFDIAQGARVFETQWSNYDYDSICGDDFYRCLWNAGWYYDKIMAMIALTESQTFFVARDTAVDVRQFRISFFDNFNWQIKKYFSGLMGENWNLFAPVSIFDKTGNPKLTYPNAYLADEQQPKLFFRNWANPVADITNPNVYRQVLKDLQADEFGIEGAGNIDSLINDLDSGTLQFVPINPAFGFTTQVYAMALGMARFQHNYDLSFYNSSRMWTTSGQAPSEIAGDFEEGDAGVAVDEDGEDNIVSYHDPENAIVYKAIKSYRPNDVLHPYGTSEKEDIGVAAAMINLANKIRSRSNDCDPISGPNAHSTPTKADNCCDDQTADDYPVTADTTDDCDTYKDPLTAKADLEKLRKAADVYLKKYRGLLDFQVRLTNVYDYYTGFLSGNPFDPGAVPEE